ncbi:alpha-tocopherol transfer protein-like isoform X1 [Centruroides sculpturatus]|uniref:alpha-tocopherol transfer protein-like isoform X1 n=1 Tax=Centruroides sculpturatus TaxID=218467 RepID=UPI000C6DBA80|nr:alpha-tocopherol transfer protein-like isoform X1 [Centruroides sculpturatus]
MNSPVLSADLFIIDSSGKERKDYLTWNENELKTFKEMVIEHNINCRLDDMFLLSFLRSRKFDKERAIKLLRNYYSTRKKYPDIFGEFNPVATKKYLDTKIVSFLPHTDQDGRVVGLVQVPYWDPSNVHMKDVLKCLLMYQDAGLTGHLIQVNGLVVIWDAKTLSWRHVLQLTPSTIFCMTSLLFTAIPIRYKEIHVVNIGKFGYLFYNALRPFLPYKIRKRIHIHSSEIESLHKFIDSQFLPEEYKGDLPLHDPAECIEVILKFQEYFEDSQKYYS